MQAVSAGGARGPFSYRRKQEKKRRLWFPKPKSS